MQGGAQARILAAELIIVGVLALAYGLWLAPSVSVVAGGSDSSGYSNYADSLLRGELGMPTRALAGPAFPSANDWAWMPLGYHMRPERGGLVPTYPIGLPLLIAAARLVTGDQHGLRLLVLALAVFVPVATYVIARRLCGLDPLWSLVAALGVAASPVFLFMALQPMSDVAATVAATAAVGLAMAAHDKDSRLLAALSGSAFGMGILIRPANLILAVPLAFALRGARTSPRWFFVGGIPAAILFATSNLALFGSPVATGYVGAADFFSLANVGPSLRNIAEWGPAAVSWPMLCLAMLGLVSPRRRDTWRRLVLASWILAPVVLYAFYLHTGDAWWYLRFLLPALPAVALVASSQGAALSRALSRRLRFASTGLAVLLGIWCVVSGLTWTRSLSVFEVIDGQREYVDAAGWLADNVRPPAAIVSMQLSGSIYHYTPHAVLRWDWLNDAALDRLRREGGKRGARVLAALAPFEVTALGERGYRLGEAIVARGAYVILDWEAVRKRAGGEKPRPDAGGSGS